MFPRKTSEHVMYYERGKPGICNEQGGKRILLEWKTHMTGVTMATE